MAKPAKFTKVPTVSEVVKRAIEAVDPAGADEALRSLERWFEDDDEPITAVSRFDERLAMATDGLDPGLEDPVLALAVATALYLWYRRDELWDDDEDLLRLAARAEWKGKPPSHVREWLEQRGIDV
jgi:hypothetical protein